MKIFVSTILVFILFYGFSSSEQSNLILGKWISQEGNVIVQLIEDSGTFKGKILWFDDTDDLNRPMNLRTDIKNPDVNLRNRRILGLDVLVGLTYNPECNCWQNGKIYDTNSGRIRSSSVKIEKENLLKICGFWHFEFLGRTMVFRRLF
ncbi:MAG: DUF2147 domain-containing protein [Chitinophagaceae bacterium]